MSSVILQAETLNLPTVFATKFLGKKVELSESENGILIKPVNSNISSARGMLKDSAFGTNVLLEQKRLEKEIEYGS